MRPLGSKIEAELGTCSPPLVKIGEHWAKYLSQFFGIVLYCIPLLYKLTERNLYYIQVGLALPTRCIYKVHVFGYICCTYY